MIYIVIPVFNRWKFTKNCLDGLYNQTNNDFKIVIVNHGSSDDTNNEIKSHYSNVILLQGDESMWWSAATNLGIKYAIENGANYILTLNNDTIAEPDYIEELYKSIKKSPANSLIGSTAISAASRQIIYSGERVHWFLESSVSLSNKINVEPANGLIEVSHFPGRGLLIPVKVFNSIGLFDEKQFPHYLADYDFTLRARKAGFEIFCSWNAKIATYPEESGANNLKNKKTIKAYIQHLFSIKGGANLPLFYKYAFRHSPLYALPSLLLLGTARRLIGYWIK